MLRRLFTIGYDLVTRAILRWAPSVEIAGVRVCFAMLRGTQRDHAYRIVVRALDILAAYSPRRLHALRREFAAVLVYDCGPSMALGEYNPRLRVCGVNAGYLDPQRTGAADAIIIAGVLVHEAVHGRLARYGYEGARLRSDRVLLHRVERLCVEAELDFVSLLPGSESLQAHYRDRLREIAETYSEHTERAERRRAFREILRLLGVPVRPPETAVRSDRPAG